MKAFIFIIILFLLFLIPTCSAAVTNGGFETGNIAPWLTGPPTDQGNHSINSTYAYTGNYGLQFTITPSKRIYIYQDVDLTDKNTVSFRLKRVSLPGSTEFKVKIDGVWRYTTSVTSSTYSMVYIDISEQSGSDQILFELKNGTGEIWLDDISVDVPAEYVLSGYVTNNLGHSVSAATINLNCSGCETTSNDTGYYEITGIDYGTYSIAATSPTHNDYSDTVNISADTEKNITMTRLTPALSNVGIIDSSENSLRIGWKENAVVDSVRIYQGTNTNLIATEDTSYISIASYTVGNLDADTGYNFWLEPWDNTISGSKYYVSGTTDGDGGGGGGGGDPTPTATGTPGPTSPPWTNITDEDWLNLTRYEQEYILFEHDQLNITIGTYTPKAVNLSFWYLILFLGICSTAYGSQKKNGELLFTCGLVAVVISMIKLGLF